MVRIHLANCSNTTDHCLPLLARATNYPSSLGQGCGLSIIFNNQTLNLDLFLSLKGDLQQFLMQPTRNWMLVFWLVARLKMTNVVFVISPGDLSCCDKCFVTLWTNLWRPYVLYGTVTMWDLVMAPAAFGSGGFTGSPYCWPIGGPSVPNGNT